MVTETSPVSSRVTWIGMYLTVPGNATTKKTYRPTRIRLNTPP